MKNLKYIFLVAPFLTGCFRQQPSETIKTPTNDSLMIKKVVQKDSAIMSYIRSINNIQSSIDTLMREARVLKKRGEPIDNDTIAMLTELRLIGSQMLKNQRTLVNLELKLKQSDEKNDELADLGENLSKELNEKDSELTVMQQALIKTRASLNNLTAQFNDSMNVIMQERAQIGLMTAANNTVYYIVGTEKELKDKRIITDEGGVIGLGRVPVLSEDMAVSGFTSTDLNELHEIPLGGRFIKLITLHSEKAYRIAHDSPDKLIITDPSDFWSKSKYMVAIIEK
ncbi:MAG: hypothetical protein ACLQQ4_07965 [Bacteroidia bacterium]